MSSIILRTADVSLPTSLAVSSWWHSLSRLLAMENILTVYLGLYALTGAVVGVLAGMLGVGGGLIVVPALAFLFEAQGLPRGVTVHLAIGTSLATIVFTSLSSMRAHHQRGTVGWGIVGRLTPGIVIGTYLGGMVAAHMGTAVLKMVFTVFLFAVAVQMLSGARPRPTRTLPGWLGSTAVGLVIGGVSSLVGIGGGSMSVPFMTFCNVEARRAIGTSAAIGFPIAVAGVATYVINGQSASTGVPYALGYVHLPALFGVALLSMLTAPLGAHLTSVMDPNRVKRGFACLLLVMSVKMAWGVLA
jgi:uncharacterized protein